MRKWEAVFSDDDRALLHKAGFGKRQAFGKIPALMIIDMIKAFLGTQPKSVLAATAEYRTSCGDAGWQALHHTQKLLRVCREKNFPVIYTTIDPSVVCFSSGATKMWDPEDTFNAGTDEILEQIKPLPSEPIIRKTKASGFFGTPLLPILHKMKVDTLFVTGGTTSGCVRATVVDAFSYNFTVFVVEECTFDRFDLSHLVNLWDINVKYADVININQAIHYVTRLS